MLWSHLVRSIPLTVLLVTFVLVAISRPAAAQFPPDSAVNLKVLRPDIEIRALIGTMRGFALGLGVRCQFCHVGEEGLPLSEFDFPSDEKVTKRKAREMLRMVETINTQLLVNVPERSDPPVEVRCETCHHGLSKPQTTVEALTEAHEEGGVNAAVSKYRELRERYYGSYSYDFGEGQLSEFAMQIARAGQVDDGIVAVHVNIEFFPKSGQSYFVLGELYRNQGNKEAAIQSYEKSLEFIPDNPVAQRRLQELRGSE
jgi:tetratricopeptide (TPR) repeat protein